MAALACYKTGDSSRLIHRPCPDARPDGRKSFSWKDYRDLIQTAHQQLDGPIVLVWDNLNTHLTTGMHRYIADRDWLTVFQLPPYAPDLNPVGGIWSVLRRTSVGNRAFTDPDDLITAVRRGLRQLQYRHDVLYGCLTGTGLRHRRTTGSYFSTYAGTSAGLIVETPSWPVISVFYTCRDETYRLAKPFFMPYGPPHGFPVRQPAPIA